MAVDQDYDNRLTRDPRDEGWTNWQGAVLLRDQIQYYVGLDPPLIERFDPNGLKSARYNLRLGEECRVGGENRKLCDKEPTLHIPPHQLAVVSTYEKVNIPGFLIGRWNLRVTAVYDGLVWVGGAQVDPGYNGHLYCPLYNWSNRSVELTFKDPLFAIDFVRTTPFGKGCTLWERTRPDTLGAHDKHYLQSAISEDLRKIDDIASRTQATERIVISALAIVIMAVTVIAMLGVFGRFEDADSLSWTSIIISGVAIFIALLALLKSVIASRVWRLVEAILKRIQGKTGPGP